MTALRKESEQELQGYFERFRRVDSVQRMSNQLNELCEVIDGFLPKIKNAIEKGIDLSPSEKETLKGLTNKYSALLKKLDDEFQKFPY